MATTLTMSTQIQLTSVLEQVRETIAPVWPLEDYVAVNPYMGLSNFKFLEASETLSRVRDGEMLMPLHYFQEKFAASDFSIQDLEAALSQCLQEYPQAFDGVCSQQILEKLSTNDSPAISKAGSGRNDRKATRVYHTIAESIDARSKTSFHEAIVGDISSQLAAHYDSGQAAWASPWQHLPLYSAWRERAMIDRRIERLGISGFRAFVKGLPSDPKDAIQALLDELAIEPQHWKNYLLCLLFSIPGWSALAKYKERSASMSGGECDDLLGLLAIRLAYDAALAWIGYDFPAIHPEYQAAPFEWSRAEDTEPQDFAPSDETLVRYACQVACELSYRNGLVRNLLKRNDPGTAGESKRIIRKTAQMVFCIDVRSEPIRRNLETVTDQIETFGFAGFFGLAIEYIQLGESQGAAQCPVLLSPAFKVREGVRDAVTGQPADVAQRRRTIRFARNVWKTFQTSSISCFTFVESLGLAYFAKLLGSSLRLSRPVANSRQDGVPESLRLQLGPTSISNDQTPIDLDKQVSLAEGILKNLGLLENFARLVVICGHGSATINNPYKAGLDCGACGGHTGEANARVAANLLNNEGVRRGLEGCGIQIPSDTWFLAALHNTTTDEIEFFDADLVPATHDIDIQSLRGWAAMASSINRDERSIRMGNVSESQLLAKSRDWSELRPEWGLAGNAAFVIAPRHRTQHADLDGRTFLHSYESRHDPEWKVLELIMTAPMIVTNWINLQYYASTVDNQFYGSGNKAIHNVVGQFGTVLGNGGDLMTGLPWQSVHDGTTYQHQPLRLFVVIEAPREAILSIIERHKMVRDLVEGGWLAIAAIERDSIHNFCPSDIGL